MITELYFDSVAKLQALVYDGRMKTGVISMYEIDKKSFGAFVSQLRKEKGYTQKELAEKLFISDKAISKWETGVSQS